MSAGASPPLTIAVLTKGDTTAAHQRAREWVAAAARFGHTCEAIVCDDGDRDGTASPRAQASRSFGAGARARLVERAVAAGCDPSVVGFALGMVDPAGPTYGANRNLLQLVTQSRVVVSLDEDLVPRVFDPPGLTPRPTVRLDDPTESWFLHDAAEAAPYECHDADAVGRLLRGLQLAPPPGFPPVRAAWLGACGQLGSPNGLHWLLHQGPSRERLMLDYSGYTSAGLVLRSVRAITLGRAGAWTPAIAAYDHTELLPPFLPSLRGEGVAWGACVTAGAAWSAVRVPGAVAHRLAEPVAARDVAATGASMALAAFVQLITNRVGEAQSNPGSAEALRNVARTIESVTRTPSTFDDFVTTEIRARSGRLAGVLEELRARYADVPAPWAADVAATLAAVRANEAHAERWAPYDLQHATEPRALMRRLLARFAALLSAWPEMVAVARGIDPAELLGVAP